MRIVKAIASLLAFAVVTPVVITTTLSFALSPFQMTARAAEPRAMLETTDLMLEDVALGADAESSGNADQDMEYGFAEWEEGDMAECAWEAPAAMPAASEGWQDPQGDFGADVGFADGSQPGFYTSDQLRYLGVISDENFQYTWYSQRVLPGGGLAIEGRHVSDEGYVVDAQERIVVASSDLAYGTELDVPFGSGKAVVLDSGCDSGTLDIYTDF